ncbi:MAG: LolA family protein [Planctomycetaceae bacterium]
MARVRSVPRSVVAAVIAMVVVASLAIGISASGATSAPDLPEVSPQALVASTLIALSKPFSVSGEVQSTVDLGLPEIPASLSSAAAGVGVSNALSALTGTQRLRVWRSPDGVRIQRITDLAEQDLVANRSQAWFWDSSTSTATKIDLSQLAASMPAPPTDAKAQLANLDPTVIAQQLLSAASTCGDVTVSGTAVVAGQDAYLLTFTPSSSTTLVGSASVAIDAATRLPLQVAVTARGGDAPAVEVGFTKVSFDPIDPSMFTFTPPPGATVVDRTEAVTQRAQQAQHDEGATSLQDRPHPVVAGTCLDTSVAVRLTQALPSQLEALLPYRGPLVSAIAVQHGGATWIVAGPVDVATLQQRAAALP